MSHILKLVLEFAYYRKLLVGPVFR